MQRLLFIEKMDQTMKNTILQNPTASTARNDSMNKSYSSGGFVALAPVNIRINKLSI